MIARAEHPRLVFVDGLPGSGKSTTSQHLYLDMRRSGRDARWYFEGVQPHPIHDPDTSAVWRREASIMCAWSRWRALAASLADARDRITLFDATLFQQTVGGAVLMDLDAGRVVDFVVQVDERLRDLDPGLVYLYRDDPEAAVRRTLAARGADWARFIQNLIADSPYGQRHRVATLADVVAYYLRCRAICDAIVPRLGMPVLALETSSGDWPELRRRAARFAGLTEPRCAEPAELIRACVGRYREVSSEHEWSLVQDEHGLRFDAGGVRLLHLEHAVFLAESSGIELNFVRDASGLVSRIECSGSVPGDPVIGTVWHRVRAAGTLDSGRLEGAPGHVERAR